MVCRFALESNGEIRTNLCTPFSPFKCPKAKSPSISIVTDFMPTGSAFCKSRVFTLYLFFSPHIKYIRISISAQSCPSVPPAPGFIVIIADILSSSALNIFLNSNSSTINLVFWSCVSSSSSPASSSSKTESSSILVTTALYDFSQLLSILSFLSVICASLGLLQKLFSCDCSVRVFASFCFSEILINL